MVFASDYPFLDILWTMLVFFAWVIWFWILITIFADLFRRHDIGGWAKAGWIVLTIFLPFIGVLIYIGTQGHGMAERRAKDVRAAQSEFDDYVRQTAGGTAAEIAKAKELLDKGTISQAEFDQIKQKALAAAG
jgi:Short C-terminal domain/Phospholipase_D-nuclease N-terminal